MPHKIGILAYGSLIDDAGEEIEGKIIDRIDTKTPFKVEFKRKSKTRSYAPTLIPVEEGGKKVKAQILVLHPRISLSEAKSMLWRRETHKQNKLESYIEPSNPTINTVSVIVLTNFSGIERVIYTSIRQNIEEPVTGEKLAELAIHSIKSEAGKTGMDGIRYLQNAKDNGIKTELSEDYEKHILQKTNTKSLKDVINKLNKQREGYHE